MLVNGKALIGGISQFTFIVISSIRNKFIDRFISLPSRYAGVDYDVSLWETWSDDYKW
jgi:hypothetical protein